MRLVTYSAGRARRRAGALIDDDRVIVDLQTAQRTLHGRPAPMLVSVLAILEGGERALDRARELAAALAGAPDASRAAARGCTAPIPEPPQMRDFLCFEKHLVQAFRRRAQLRAQPRPIRKPRCATWKRRASSSSRRPGTSGRSSTTRAASACAAPSDDVPWPAYSQRSTSSCEFGCYIGTPGKDIPREHAREHIFGYTIFNDFSARDEQTQEMPGQLGPGKGKDFDNANAMGPCLVTADEIPDPYALDDEGRASTARNGAAAIRATCAGSSRTASPTCRAPRRCIRASSSARARSATAAASSTCAFSQPGDVVELEVERIGVLRNRVVKP